MDSSSWLLFIGLTYILLTISTHANNQHEVSDEQKAYIVYMGDLPENNAMVESHHLSILQEVIGSTRASESLLRSYTRSFNGFVAMLTEAEKEEISGMEGIVSIFPDKMNELHTTRSWDFMGFPMDVKRSPLESDVIVGMIDSGIWPESASFSDADFPPAPVRWKGPCDLSNFICNKKVIGARWYDQYDKMFEKSARDTMGHGTHTASTVAGCAVKNVSDSHFAKGTAHGGVPSARIAVYKVCGPTGCSDSDVLSAFNDAVADGVDVISISLGPRKPQQYFEDPVAIGAYHAMKRGILTLNSAGNEGPDNYTITNFSPWSLSVAASSMGRKFVTKITLGNNKMYEGVSINAFEAVKAKLVNGRDVPNAGMNYTEDQSRYCSPNSLDETLVYGTIVLCDVDKEHEIYLEGMGLIGAILQGDWMRDAPPEFYPLPLSLIGSTDGSEVAEYISSTSEPFASILRSVEINDTFAPTVASFSSKGPNPVTRDILKPDLTAPGVNILAAWTGSDEEGSKSSYKLKSGTSMSCPHASAAAAYVKSFNPDWSPAAIKSALMTTASLVSANKNSEAEFAYGSGHIDPLKAKDPGLIYDIEEANYVSFLCGQGYSKDKLEHITRMNISCLEASNITVWNLNYPSFALSSHTPGTLTRTFQRTVTNVGSSAITTYVATVTTPIGLEIIVEPTVLSFNSMGPEPEKQSFTVTVTAEVGSAILSGSLTWSDGNYTVRSPVVAYQDVKGTLT